MLAQCLAVICALLALQAQAQSDGRELRCAYDASGDLVGHEVTLSSLKLKPAGQKVYHEPIESFTGCILNGVAAKVCDLFPPEVEIEANHTMVTVRRLGPRLHAISLEITLFCDPILPPKISV